MGNGKWIFPVAVQVISKPAGSCCLGEPCWGVTHFQAVLTLGIAFSVTKLHQCGQQGRLGLPPPLAGPSWPLGHRWLQHQQSCKAEDHLRTLLWCSEEAYVPALSS